MSAQITDPQGTSKTGMTTESPTKDPVNDLYLKTARAIPKSDVIAESGYSAVEMAPGVPPRNTPTRKK